MTLGEYLNTWLETYVIPFRAPNTISCYRARIESLPAELAAVPLGEVDGLRLQRAVNTQAAVHPRTAQLTYAVLHTALARAVKLRLIPYSPMDAVDKPIHRAKRAEVLDMTELACYIEHARASKCWPLLLMMATLGLRRGEALGLMWTDITGGVLHVQRQRINGQSAPLKSESSDRFLQLPAPLVSELMQLPIRSITGYVCDTWPKHLAKEHYRVIEAAGVKRVTLHGLRHSMAYAAVASGTAIKVLQAILGHSSYVLTADLYADHVQVDVTAPSLEVVCSNLLMSRCGGEPR